MPDPTNEPAPTSLAGSIPDPTATQTDQILGSAAEADERRQKIDPKWHRFYDELIKQRDALIDAKSDLQSKAREVSPDPIQDEPAEIGSEEFQRDQLLGVVSFDQETIDEIEQAISRMENGTYGICEVTGKPISEERLAAVPWTRFSVEAQREMENRGEGIKASIGPRGNYDERNTAPPGRERELDGSA
jgi:RNA polymerase-binding transcription factor DksA